MCISRARSTWGTQWPKDIQLSENLKFEASTTQRLGTRGNSKLLGRIMVIVFNVPFPYIYHSPKFSKNPWSHAIGRLPPNSSNLSLCPFIWNSHLFYLRDFFYFWWQYLKQNFQKDKIFLHSLESVNNKHTFFELTSSWSVHQPPIRERLHSGRETWLSTMERTSALSKMQS